MCARPVRRSQAVSPFGVGAIVDFPGPVSLIHAGIDAWPYDETANAHREFRIDDEKRLARRLGVSYFVEPPDYRRPAKRGDAAQQVNMNLHLPFLRFPRWHFCPRCGLMKESALHDRGAPHCRGPIATGQAKGQMHKSRRMIQVRFVTACIRGHSRDFPWWEWLFRGSVPEKLGLRLRLNTTGSASLAGVTVICEKDVDFIEVVEKRPLAGVFGSSDEGSANALSRIGVVCNGDNPVIGFDPVPEEHAGCGELLQVLIRGSSNFYFPHTVSSIYIPPISDEIDVEILEFLDDANVKVALDMFADGNDGQVTEGNVRTVLKRYCPHLDLDVSEVTEAANRQLSGELEADDDDAGEEITEEAYRHQEYCVLRQAVQKGYPRTDLFVTPNRVTDYDSFLSPWFTRISLVPKLRETRAFAGFSRIRPQPPTKATEIFRLISRQPKTWLPGIVVRGEGIFLELDPNGLREWYSAQKEFIGARVEKVNRTLSALREQRGYGSGRIDAGFLVVHTLAHLLINQLIFDCGYGSASLRERLYCSVDGEPMAGVLIYTAAGDSEGTLGGLVRMGEPGRFELVFRRAIESARWCSSDPICIESGGQGPDNCNLAACHACGLLPETSCETQNRFLDRGMLVGDMQNPDAGFFSSYFS